MFEESSWWGKVFTSYNFSLLFAECSEISIWLWYVHETRSFTNVKTYMTSSEGVFKVSTADMEWIYSFLKCSCCWTRLSVSKSYFITNLPELCVAIFERKCSTSETRNSRAARYFLFLSRFKTKDPSSDESFSLFVWRFKFQKRWTNNLMKWKKRASPRSAQKRVL